MCKSCLINIPAFFVLRVNWFIHNFLQRDPTTRSKITSPSREVSKDSIHVKAKMSSSSAKRLSLAVESLSEYPTDNNPERSQSASHLRRSSAVSLTVPGTSGFRSNSLPGSSTEITEIRNSKIEFQGVEIHITNERNTQDEHFVNEGYDKDNEETNSKDIDRNTVDDEKIITNDEKMTALPCDENESSRSRGSSASSPRQRRKGMVKVSTAPIPSVEM